MRPRSMGSLHTGAGREKGRVMAAGKAGQVASLSPERKDGSGLRPGTLARRAVSAAAGGRRVGTATCGSSSQKFPKSMRRQTSKGQRTQNKQAGSPLRLSPRGSTRRDCRGRQRERLQTMSQVLWETLEPPGEAVSRTGVRGQQRR